MKIAGVQHFAQDVCVGAIVRYQDGQAFSRMVVTPDLNQGAEAIRAFRSGKSRFTYRERWTCASRKASSCLEVAGLSSSSTRTTFVNMAKEVEEWVARGPAFRTPTAVQPPRAIHVGLRLSL